MKQHKSPMTLALIVDANNILRDRGLGREQFRIILNRFLPEKRKIKGDHSGIVKLNRWLDPTGNNWPEPKSEIALAIQKSIENILNDPSGASKNSTKPLTF